MEFKLTMAEIRRKDIRIGDTLVVEPTSDGNVCLRVLLRRRPASAVPIRLTESQSLSFEGINTVTIRGSATGNDGTYKVAKVYDVIAYTPTEGDTTQQDDP